VRRLHALTLSHNSLASLPLLPVSLKTLVSMHMVDVCMTRLVQHVNDNLLHDVGAITSLRALERLSLQENDVDAVPAAIAALPLVVLRLDFNALMTLPIEFGRL
jgi:Leucine-rich repeat (LRR) protein